MFIIYIHTHKENKKSYVGMTGVDPKKRGKEGKGYRTQPKFYRAIKKYGGDAFDHKILEECENEKIAIEREKFFIKEYNSFYNGYNGNEGGEGGFGRSNSKPVYQIDKKTLKIVKEGDSTMDIERELGINNTSISDACLGKNISSYGYYGVYKMDYKKDWKPRHKRGGKPVRCKETGKTYISAKEAARQVGKRDSKMVQQAANPNSRYKTAFGFHGEYIEGEEFE